MCEPRKMQYDPTRVFPWQLHEGGKEILSASSRWGLMYAMRRLDRRRRRAERISLRLFTTVRTR